MTNLEKILAFLEENETRIVKIDKDNYLVDGKAVKFCHGEKGFVACKVEGFGFPVLNADATTVEMALSAF